MPLTAPEAVDAGAEDIGFPRAASEREKTKEEIRVWVGDFVKRSWSFRERIRREGTTNCVAESFGMGGRDGVGIGSCSLLQDAPTLRGTSFGSPCTVGLSGTAILEEKAKRLMSKICCHARREFVPNEMAMSLD